jgi:hypothetical protein
MTAEKCLADRLNEGKSEICQAQSRDSAAMAR